MNRKASNSVCPGALKRLALRFIFLRDFSPGTFFVPAGAACGEPARAEAYPIVLGRYSPLTVLHGLTVNQPQAGVNDGREWRDNQPMGERLLAGWRAGGPGSETSSDSKHYSGGSCNTLEKP